MSNEPEKIWMSNEAIEVIIAALVFTRYKLAEKGAVDEQFFRVSAATLRSLGCDCPSDKQASGSAEDLMSSPELHDMHMPAVRTQ